MRCAPSSRFRPRSCYARAQHVSYARPSSSSTSSSSCSPIYRLFPRFRRRLFTVPVGSTRRRRNEHVRVPGAARRCGGGGRGRRGDSGQKKRRVGAGRISLSVFRPGVSGFRRETIITRYNKYCVERQKKINK